LKPENVLLTGAMHVLLTDFGTACILPKEEQEIKAAVAASASSQVPDYVHPPKIDDSEVVAVSPIKTQPRTRVNSFVGTAE
jgi:serine/threonine protein kinase